jgi:DegV family protein with EDD domain
MGKYKIIIDSTVYLDEKTIKENDIDIASLNVIEGENSYREVEVSVQFIFDEQDKGKSWTTSQPSPGEFLELYEQAFKDGYEKVFVSGLSKDISGTYQSASLAKNMLDDSEKVYIFDTQLAAYGTEMIALELIRLRNNGVEFDSIIKQMNNLIKHSGQMFTVENLFSLVKGGRLSAAKAAIGTVLRVKPVIKIVDGKLKLVHSERTYKKLHKYIIDEMKRTSEGYKRIHIYITNQFSPGSGEVMKSVIMEHFPDAEITYTDYLGPVFSIHVGRKGYGISWCWE